jgi:hypothetical protein
MAEKTVKMWFDAEADFLEVIFEQKAGHLPCHGQWRKWTASFSVLRVSSLKKTPLEVALRHSGTALAAVLRSG